MNCKEARQRMTPYVDGELADTEQRAVEQHVESCTACARRVAFETNFNRILRQGLLEREVPAGVIARVRRSIAAEARSDRIGFGRWILHPLTAYATAAALLLALVLPVTMGNAPGFAGWQQMFRQPLGAVSGTLVCVECDRAHAPAEMQRNCRRFNHQTGIRTSEGAYWVVAHRDAGVELNERPELRGALVSVEGEAFVEIDTFHVRAYELG